MATSDIYETAFDEEGPSERTTEAESCPRCDGVVRTNTSETVCEDCGLVIADQRIDHGPEWRAAEAHDHSRTRTGASLTVRRHDRGLSTEITVEYPSRTSLDGLTEAAVTVYMDRDGDGTVDEIRVNKAEYSGHIDTFDLDGRYDTTVAGEVRVEIDGMTNPNAGEYVATETLDGDETYSVDAAFTVA